MNPRASVARSTREPPLVIEERTETDPETGDKICVTISRRGILQFKTVHYNSTCRSLKAMGDCSAEQYFMKLCDALRDQLERWGLPSDRQPRWIKVGSSDWVPYIEKVHGALLLRHAEPISAAIWYSRVKELTEPLSEKRCVGELLFQLIRMLEREGINPHLWHIAQCMGAVSTLRVAGNTNFFAAAGLAAHKGRAAGPTARQQRAAKSREIIWSLAQEFWAACPLYKHDAANTAANIIDQVNERLRSKGLLPPGVAGLKPKTIADHIRTTSRAKMF